MRKKEFLSAWDEHEAISKRFFSLIFATFVQYIRQYPDIKTNQCRQLKVRPWESDVCFKF